MVDDFLSQAEVESLLTATDSEGGTAHGLDDGEDCRQSARLSSEVSPCDLKRPQRVGKETMRALQTMHEEFGRNFGTALSALLRNRVEVKLARMDQLTYSDCIWSATADVFQLDSGSTSGRSAYSGYQFVDSFPAYRPAIRWE